MSIEPSTKPEMVVAKQWYSPAIGAGGIARVHTKIVLKPSVLRNLGSTASAIKDRRSSNGHTTQVERLNIR